MCRRHGRSSFQYIYIYIYIYIYTCLYQQLYTYVSATAPAVWRVLSCVVGSEGLVGLQLCSRATAGQKVHSTFSQVMNNNFADEVQISEARGGGGGGRRRRGGGGQLTRRPTKLSSDFYMQALAIEQSARLAIMVYLPRSKVTCFVVIILY